MVKWLACLLLLVSCGSGAASAPTPSPPVSVSISPPSFSSPTTPPPAQRQEASLPVPVEETAAAAAGGKLYVMGGFNAAGASLSSVFVFDGTTWSSGPRLPLAVDHPSAATLEDQVYIAGGHSFGIDSPRLFRLDGDHWSELAQMRFARGGHALIAAQGKLYAVGGNTFRGNVAAVESYDPGTNTWTTLPSLPVPRNHVSGFALGSLVCVAGGRSPTTSRVDCFDAASGSWSRLPDVPQPASGGGAATFLGGDVIYAGGQDASETRIVAQLTRYSAGRSWTSGESMLSPRHGFELAVFEGRAWACGGGSAPGLHPVATCTSLANPSAVVRGK